MGIGIYEGIYEGVNVWGIYIICVGVYMEVTTRSRFALLSEFSGRGLRLFPSCPGVAIFKAVLYVYVIVIT